MILSSLHGLRILSSQNLPNDPFFEYQWNLYNDGNNSDSSVAGADINILRAWKITEGSSDIVIAMFDRGVDLDSINLELHHPEMNDIEMHLLGKNFTTAWGGDPENVRDGFQCDYKGQEIGNFTCEYAGQVFGGHGTWVSGVIFAEKNNKEGIAGIAPRVSALHNRVLGGSPTRREDFKNASLDINQKASENPNKRYIVNYSAGWFSDPDHNTLLQGVQYLKSKDVILVSGSGNNNIDQVYYPARYAGDFDNVIAVGATVDNDNRCVVGPGSGSNYGPELTIVAPGRLIPTTDLVYAESDSLPGPYRLAGTSCSTSMSVPHVTGVIGLILSINNQLTPLLVREILKESADEVGDVVYQNGFHKEMGFGRLNAYKALIHTIQNHGAVLGKDKDHVQLILENDMSLTVDVALADNSFLTINAAEEAHNGIVTLIAENGTVTIGGQWDGPGSRVDGGINELAFRLEQTDEATPTPERYRLFQNYPNPFNPETIFQYEIPKESPVRLEIFDITGRLVTVVVDEMQQPGSYQVTWDASNIASGIYIYRLRVDGFVQSRRMTLIK